MKQKRLQPVMLEHEWPITDPDIPIRVLHEEAFTQVLEGARQLGYLLASAPVFRITHGANPVLGMSIMAVKR